MKDRRLIAIVLLGSLLTCSLLVRAQDPTARFRNLGGGGGRGGAGGDSLQHRKNDTITLNFRYLDSSRLQKLDSSLNFSSKVPQPPTYINLGNMGTPARDLVFSPRMQSGWDAGWHAYDLYTFKVNDTRFYNTTKPYTELGYLLGGKGEQIIDIQHTQNVLPNWNLAIEYRLINSPGSFQNQNTNHNNYRGSSWYQSKNKRYQSFFILAGSKLQAAENGGLADFHDLESSSTLVSNTTAVRLGNNLATTSGNIFSSNITTGTHYTTTAYLFRQQYDLGQKDSIVTDTTVIPLFYPRLRLEHTISYTTYHYRFLDQFVGIPGSTSYTLDTAYYANYYHLSYIAPQDSFFRETRWHDLTNDFSIYQFPDSKNAQQFIKLGASLQLLNGVYDTSNLVNGSQINITKRLKESNEFIHGEYRNKTRNRKWDIEAFGKLYLSGLNAGDYNAYISLQRYVSRKIGYLQVGFQNVNRTPSSVFDGASPFYYDTARSFSKENTTNIFASIDEPLLHLKLKGAYYLMSNYAYFTNYFEQRQQAALFNLLQVSAQKEISLSRVWKWRALVVVQKTTGSSPVHVPLLISYNQIGYEGNFGFRNLTIDFGLEVRYVSGYKPDGYAPLSGQFFTQSDTTIRQHLPDITPYLALRIRSFTAYLRAENFNTMQFSQGFGFTNYNFVAPNYPSPGLWIRFGFFWSFIN